MAKKTVTVDGIKVSIDERVFKDYHFQQLCLGHAKLSKKKEELTEEEMIGAEESTFKLIDLVLRDEKEYVLEEFAKANDGFIEIDKLFAWVEKLISEIDAGKN